MTFNYQKICSDLLKDLSPRTQDVLLRRFGIKSGQRETLESIGQTYGVTRERIRQIEEDGLSKIEPKLKEQQKVFKYFTDFLKHVGNLKKEDLLLSQVGGEEFNPQVFFLLTLSRQFERFSENQNLHSLWTIDPKSLDLAKEVIDDFYKNLKVKNQPLTLQGYNPPISLKKPALVSYLEVSKLIEQGPQGAFGLKEWPEINPKGVKDKAYLVFKRKKKPLHFSEVAKLISPPALEQTAHNELIRDPRFVLVGRGLYALREWGYDPGTVRDVIIGVLTEAGGPLSKEELVKEVLKRRFVKTNTVLLNLSNKKYFSRDSRGRYTLRNG